MKKLSVLLSIVFFLSAFTSYNNIWTNDDPHSQVGFTVTHLGISEVSGNFTDFDVKVTSNKADFSDAIFEFTAKVGSIDTRVEARDKHLKSPDFFDAVQYPTINFKSSSIKQTAENEYSLAGDLTMHGVTRPVALGLKFNGIVENPMSKKQTAGFQLTGTIKRSNFNIGASFPEAIISDEVRIKADGEFIQ